MKKISPFKIIPVFFEQSLAANTLLRFAIRLTVVVLSIAALSYWHIVSELEVKTRSELLSYISERGQKESAIFKLAEDNHAVFKQAFIELWQNRKNENPKDFNKHFVKLKNGTTRTRNELFEGMRRPNGTISKGISGFIQMNAPLDSQEFRDKMSICLKLVDHFMDGWTNRFSSTYCHTPNAIIAAFYPVSVIWGANLPATFDMSAEEWNYVADMKHNPEREPVYTGLYFDTGGAKVWMVSLETPVDVDGKHILTIGHDIFLDKLIERVSKDFLQGTYNFIVREDGNLIAHPTLVSDLSANTESVTVQSLNNQTLSSMYQQIINKLKNSEENVFVLDDEVDQAFLAVTRIAGPNWLFVTVYPKSLLETTGRSIAIFILGISLLSLILELVMLHIVMKGSVVGPLKAFMSASNAVAKGDYQQVANGEMNLPEGRKDEVGSLARTFRTMSQRVEDSHGQLEASEKRYRNVFDSSRDVILITDSEGAFVDVNPAVTIILGYSCDEILSLTTENICVDLADCLRIMEESKTAGFVCDYELKLRRKDAVVIDALISTSLRHDDDGNIIGLQATIRDVTAQKAAERLRNQYQEHLEQEVTERTMALSLAHKKLNDSIEYASLIQKAILPTQQLTEFLSEDQSVVWLPRDIVGGDFYIFHVHEQSYLLGVIDCAGHGIPGALMTMLARAALDQAISEHGIGSPAMLLEKMDAILRNRLQNAKMSRGLAVNMDAGLVFVDPRQQRVLFAGAKMSLYWTDGQQVEEIKGGNRAVLGNKAGHYEDIQLPIKPSITFCMTSDGILDQAGGAEGFGFGNTRFTNVFRQHASQPASEQADIMMNTINDYRGDYEQRDDITLLFFKPKYKKTGII